MLLWSIQHQCAYEKMEQSGVLRADKNFIATDWFEDSYLWMAEQMKKRIGEPPEGVIFPVWAWYQWEASRTLHFALDHARAISRSRPDNKSGYKAITYKLPLHLTFCEMQRFSLQL